MNEMILVVDDEPKIVKQARDYLEKGGFRVVTAADGKKALVMSRHIRIRQRVDVSENMVTRRFMDRFSIRSFGRL